MAVAAHDLPGLAVVRPAVANLHEHALRPGRRLVDGNATGERQVPDTAREMDRVGARADAVRVPARIRREVEHGGRLDEYVVAHDHVEELALRLARDDHVELAARADVR